MQRKKYSQWKNSKKKFVKNENVKIKKSSKFEIEMDKMD